MFRSRKVVLMNKVGINDFRGAVNEILEEYGDAAQEAVEVGCKETAKDASKKLQSAGSFKGGKEYRKGWTSKVEQTRLGAVAVVYNKTKPGLSHLLEFGHALRDGGRSTAFNFIAPIDEGLGAELTENIEKRLGG